MTQPPPSLSPAHTTARVLPADAMPGRERPADGLRLDGLVCLITGADVGLGKGFSLGFAARGAQVVAGLLHAEIPPADPRILGVAMDVTNERQVAAAVATTMARFGRIDVLINNAGIYPRCPAPELTFALWRQMLDLNLDGAWRCIAAAVPHLRTRGGSIINIGSITHRIGMADLAHYHASKAGLAGLTRGLARDLGRDRVRVNCLELGAVMTEGELARFDPDETARNVDALQSIPGRLTPATVEPVAAFFASPASSDITGQTLAIDRGWTFG